MEIHTPDGPTRSLREFAIHIAIVTVGILIALSLEGVREMVHEHNVASEAREAFHIEAEGNEKNMLRELDNVSKMKKQLDAMLADLPQLQQHPEQIAPRVEALEPSFYFFSSTRWESALSTGALGFMKPAEVDHFANENILIHSYQSLEAAALPVFIDLQSFFRSHRALSPADVDAGVQKLMIFRSYIGSLTNVGDQLQSSIETALGKQ